MYGKLLIDFDLRSNNGRNDVLCLRFLSVIFDLTFRLLSLISF